MALKTATGNLKSGFKKENFPFKYLFFRSAASKRSELLLHSAKSHLAE
jgi:hypothetical protein